MKDVNRQNDADSPAAIGDGMANAWPQDQRDIDAREALQTAMPDTTDCNECGHLGVNVGANCPRCGKRSAPFGPESKLRVFYGPMPESNGKHNYTAILYRDNGNDVLDLADGITIERSEFPDRVRYEADRLRYLLGELADRPDILDYDADKHSGYVARPAPEALGAAGVSDEAAMRVALTIIANLEDRRGVLDDIDDEIKQEIADEIAVTIKTQTFPKEQA
ncbi:hypothetical protein [Cupriavidus sp. EM10]|uniref:hypothetical protein n=1 Tax=Cupriavidus sp. EM10 TaxID=2839983 RepID=UPI001BFFE37B|nr:hypothetical protein [Cupriavidus sp. EM10]QWE95367.1 hypothetical protein KLP38_05595 [Cupriavidus sp. EM10]